MTRSAAPARGRWKRILRELVPRDFVTAVSPFSWDKEYFVASLAGSRLNVVGELPDDKSIPSAAFKTVLGGDLITGRHPSHRPITFKNGAVCRCPPSPIWECTEFPTIEVRNRFGSGVTPRIRSRNLLEIMGLPRPHLDCVLFC